MIHGSWGIFSIILYRIVSRIEEEKKVPMSGVEPCVMHYSLHTKSRIKQLISYFRYIDDLTFALSDNGYGCSVQATSSSRTW